jgi:hypothetical protein
MHKFCPDLLVRGIFIAYLQIVVTDNEMRIIKKQFSFDRDLDNVRTFLLDVYNQTGELHYLLPTRIENQKFGPCGPDYSPEDDEAIKIWKTSDSDDSEIIAISHRGSSANYHIEMHPNYKHLERELFQEIEKLESSIVGKQRSRMYMYHIGPDTKRATVLRDMNYEEYGLHEYNYAVPKDAEVPDNPSPEGFKIRSLRGEQDYPQFIEVIGSAYDHCRQHMTIDKMKFMTKAEFYHQDLNLVVVNEEERFVAFCMYRLDPLTQIGEMEAVDVHPDYRSLRLESALVSEGIKRVRKYQPNQIYAVEVDVSDPQNQLLKNAGFVRTVTMNMWGKTIN